MSQRSAGATGIPGGEIPRIVAPRFWIVHQVVTENTDTWNGPMLVWGEFVPALWVTVAQMHKRFKRLPSQ